MTVDPVERIAFLVRMVSGALTQQIEQALRPLRLTQVQLATLAQLALSSDGGLSGAELGRRAGITSQSMASALADMRQRDLISRTPHPTHGRVIEIRITTAGREVLGHAQELTAGVDARALALLDADDRSRLRELLTRVATGLGLPVTAEGSTVQPEDGADV